jgi:hypothetical protein
MAHVFEKGIRGKGVAKETKGRTYLGSEGRGARARDQVHGALTDIPMQPSGVAGSRAQRATLRQSSSPQTRQQVKASHTLRATLAQVARRSVPNPRGITGDRERFRADTEQPASPHPHPHSGGCNHFFWYHAPHFDSITWMRESHQPKTQ